MADFMDRLTTMLKRHEGLRLVPYTDSVGIWTIGYGRNLEKGLSVDEADYLLKNDIREAMRELDREKPWWKDLPDEAKLVVLSMQFNLGWPAFAGFRKMWAALEVGNYPEAAKEMRDSVWFLQVKGRGKELADQMANVTELQIDDEGHRLN